jgi:hypothetical protein
MGHSGAPAGRHRRTRGGGEFAPARSPSRYLPRRRTARHRPWATGARVAALIVGASLLIPLQPGPRQDQQPEPAPTTPAAKGPKAARGTGSGAGTAHRPVVARVAADWADAEPNTELDSLWNDYGDKGGGQWTGGDCGASVPLPDGRIVWLFCDTFLGAVDSDGSRSRRTPLIRNSIVIQDGTTLTARYGGSRRKPESLLGPTHGGIGSTMFWPADGMVAGGRLMAFYTQMTRTGRGSLDYRPSGTAVGGFTLPGLDPTGYRILPLDPRISWGMAVLEEPDHTYIYGVEETPAGKFLHLARVKPGDLLGPWEFATGTGWSPDEAASARLMSGVGHGFSVDRVDGRVVLITVDSNLTFSPHIVAYAADGPAGPFRDQTYLYRAPEVELGRSRVAYTARLHPELGKDGKLVVSYNVNDLNVPQVFADVTVYRPRFVDVTLRREPPDREALPDAPTELTAETGATRVHLSWTEPEPGAWYWLYRRDLTSGHQSFSRLSLPVTSGTSADLDHFADGRTYEYLVTAVNDAGEGPPSNVVRVPARSAKRAR